MRKFRMKPIISALALAGTIAWPAVSNADRQQVMQLSQLQVNYRVTDNRAGEHGTDCAALGADFAACNRAVISLTNPGAAIDGHDWTLWFHSIRRVLKVDSDRFKITAVTGDLHKLEPTAKFSGFAQGERVEIPIIGEYWQLFESDVMPRWYVTAPGVSPQVIRNTDTEDVRQFVTPLRGDSWKRIDDDQNVLMTAASRYEKNADVQLLSSASLRGQILPTPLQLRVFPQNISLKRGVNLDLTVLDRATATAVRQRFSQLGVRESGQGYRIHTAVAVRAFSGNYARAGAYRLRITPQGAHITGYDQAGVFYGLQSLFSLLPGDGQLRLATLESLDAPRFDYRAIFLDVGRNFHSKAVILRLLDQMAAYKLNTFHFHLSDDEGWRIEIPGLPELTEIGSKRCHDLSETRCLLPQLGSGPDSENNGSGFFSRADYIEIVRYAAARKITVLPEIDMPAHARAALIAMEARYKRLMAAGDRQGAERYRLLDPGDQSSTTTVQYYDRHSYLNPCLPSSARFVAKVIAEIAQMHKEAGQPLQNWHFGGDEAKNIYLGPGYQDKNGAPQPGRGQVDLSRQDRPWEKSPVCQAMVKAGAVQDIGHLPSAFALAVSKLVAAQGINTMQAWQDGVKDASSASAFATRQVNVNFWDTLYWGGFDSANDWAAKGFRVIMTNPDYLYLDFPYEVDPQEPGYYWGTRFSDERKIFAFAPDNLPQNAETSVDRDGKPFTARSDKPWPGALGISAHLWSEGVRTDTMVEYKIYPRLLAVAERAWHRAPWELNYQAGREFSTSSHYVNQQALRKDWQRFANLLGQRELYKLDERGIGYRLPLPGGKVVDGVLWANTAFPGLEIEYSLDEGLHWLSYRADRQPCVSGSVWLRSVSPDGKRFSRSEKL